MIRRALLLALAWGGVARAQSPGHSLRRRRPRRRARDPGASARQAAHASSARQPPSDAAARQHLPAHRHRSRARRRRPGLGARRRDRHRRRPVSAAGGGHHRPRHRDRRRRLRVDARDRRTAASSSYRDFTYDITPIAERILAPVSVARRHVRCRRVTLPGFFGLRLPSYDRTNGLSLAVVAARLAESTTGSSLEPGSPIDRSSASSIRRDRRRRRRRREPTVRARRSAEARSRTTRGSGTTSSTAPRRSSAATTRATTFARTRGDATLARRWEWRTSTIEPFIGGLWESARSVRPDSNANGGPWSFRGSPRPRRHASPEPADRRRQRSTSVLVGGRLDWADDDGTTARLRLDGEWGHLSPIRRDSPTRYPRPSRKRRSTARSAFPTFGPQSLRFEGHALITLTSGAAAPALGLRRRRRAVCRRIELLSRGRRPAALLRRRYNIPLERWKVPLLGAPIVSLREILAGADVGRFPALAQATGVRLAMSVVYVEFLVDPARRHGILSGRGRRSTR